MYHRSGDEILILLPNFDQAEAYAVAERVRQEIESFEFPSVGRGTVTATLGLATYPTSCDTLTDLEKKADQAAMGAKHRKNIVVESAIKE
ncbi:MAG: diguanylate cyclase [Chloracidobacterium sp.]|nr:diguanylate cyclase [Chloracidobacterium sp.]